jgi:hypothetical protein
MATTPWMTTNDLIEAVKRKISFPTSQATFTDQDIVKFANEEMFISQVPSVLEYHEEYFVYQKTVPLKTNVNRYAIPDRATGMKLRDLFFQDSNGNLVEMVRVNADDRAFFQRNVGANTTVYKFFLQGNDVVITPSVTSDPSGSLLFVFFLRPNQLVVNSRAASINGFNQTITVNSSLIQVLDTVNVDNALFTAVNTNGGSISAIEYYSSLETKITTSTPHQLTEGQIVTISGSDCVPSIDGDYEVSVLDDTKFLITKEIGVNGSTGSFTSPNFFVIGGTDALTTTNLTSAINLVGLGDNGPISATSSTNVIQLKFQSIKSTVSTSRTVAFVIPQNTIGIQFDNVPTTFQDPDTLVTSPLFTDGSKIDLLQRKPGHRTWCYDVQIPENGISGNSVFFNKNSILIPSMTTGNSDSSVIFELPDLEPGDYMCLANEAIIPQIPPDLHTGLAERAAARILSAIGDLQGEQAQMQKIQAIEERQGNLLDSRVDGSPIKIMNKMSLLRLGKFGTRRRY